MELPDGLGVSVPQLACVCASVRLSLRCSHCRPQLHAREPALLPGGQQIFGGDSCDLQTAEGLKSFHLKAMRSLFLVFPTQNGKHDEGWMILKQVHDTNMRAKGYPERVFSVSICEPLHQT